MLRAMRSWTVSRRTAYNFEKFRYQDDSRRFLSGFVLNLGASFCNCCRRCRYVDRFASALCLDCTGSYYICDHAAGEHYPNSPPTRDDVSRLLVHERLSTDGPHEYIWFGKHVEKVIDGFYGVESSLSVLEYWYARNSRCEDGTLD